MPSRGASNGAQPERSDTRDLSRDDTLGTADFNVPTCDSSIVPVTMSSVTIMGYTDNDTSNLTGSDGTGSTSVRYVMRANHPSSSSGNKKTSPVWDYFCHFDLAYHPNTKCHRICLVCRAKGVDKAISVGQSASPGPLINHLKTHKDQYAEFMEKKDAKKVESEKAASSQSSMSSYLTAASSIKKLFKVKFAKWVVQQSMPLSIGESTDFIEMIQVANKTIVVPDHKALSDILYEKKQNVHASFASS